MPRRIEIELTSSRDDGTWTWRAAGAKAPRGTVPGGLLPAGAKAGDVLRVEAEFFVDGIEITSVLPPKGGRSEPQRLELIAPAGKDEPLVTTTLASRSRDDRGPRRDGPRRDRPSRDGERGGGERGGGGRGGDRSSDRGGDRARGPRPDADQRTAERGPRREGADRPRRNRPEPPPMPAIERPKAKRLRAGKAHRNALLASLPEEQRPIAEQVVLGGLPAVRQAIEKQNAERSAAGEPAISAGPLLEIAEKLVPKVRAAEWRDRAEAAQRDLEHLDLRDLRSVVSTADAAGKDEDARALAQSLKEGLVARVDAEHTAWLEELTATLDVGRIVRALRVSSRPPKAGAPLPPEIAARLVAGASEALVADAAAERWVAVLDALAFAPVRDKVIPTSLPTELHPDVRATVARLATRIPKIAHIFEIEPDRNAPRPKPERRRPPKPKKPAGADKPRGEKPKGTSAPAADESATETAPTTDDVAPTSAGRDAAEAPEAAAPSTPESAGAASTEPEATAVSTEPAAAQSTEPQAAESTEPEADAVPPTAPSEDDQSAVEATTDAAPAADESPAPAEVDHAEVLSSEPAAAPDEVAQPAPVADAAPAEPTAAPDAEDEHQA